jgi:shikimate kinase
MPLDRHVALVGFFVDQTRTVGYRLAALLGLSALDLDRHVEHTEGMSIRHLLSTRGEAAYRDAERRSLERCLADRPFGILTLGDGALVDDESRRRVAAETHLLALDLEMARYYWQLTSLPDAAASPFHWLHGGPPSRFEDVRPYYEKRRPGMDAAAHRLELAGRSESDLAQVARDWVQGIL